MTMLYWTDVVSLTGAGASVAVSAFFIFLFGLNWYALGVGAAAFIIAAVAITVILRIIDERESTRGRL
jgi:hypothetical protein